MSYNLPLKLKKIMKPGTVWSRVNHQYPDQVGGEIVTEKGTPVKVQVQRVDKDGIALELLGRPGTISYLSWPDPLYMWVTMEPDKITIENRYGPLLTYTRDMAEARSVIENIDSYEGGVPRPVNPFKDQIDRLLKGPDYEPELRYDYQPTDPKFKEQWPEPELKWHLGHRSSRMSLNRNNRRKSFGYQDAPSSLRDRGWPYANRGFDRRRKAWEKAVAKFGQVRGAGEGI